MGDAPRGLKVLVTGGTGFLGRRVCRMLEEAGQTPIPMSRRSGYDLRNESEALSALLITRPDVVVHLAAVVGGIGANMAQPGVFFRDNMLLGLNVIHAAAMARARVVVAGTVCSYPRDCPVPFQETAFWDGFPEETNAPYGIAKKALLEMCRAYRKQHGLSYGYLVPCNLFGPEDNFDEKTSHVIPALVRRFVEAKEARQKKVVCWGTGSATRSFLHVDDAAAAIAIACAALDHDGPVNLAGGEETSMKDLASMVARLVGYEGTIAWDKTKPDGQPRRAIDGTLAEKLLRWKPSVPLETGLKQTIEWYQSTLPEVVYTKPPEA